MTDIVSRLIYGTQLRNYDALVELCKEAAAEIERLRAVLGKLEWKSIDKDNMEYSCRVPYNVMDEIRRDLEPKP